MNINTLDLNLLKAFHALYEERHVGRAADRIGLAQPSMSNALNRLRAQFEDPLFHRGPAGMVPTERAEAVAPQIQQALMILSGMLERPTFDPREVDDKITIAAADLDIMMIAAPLMTYLADAAPNLRTSFVSMNKKEIAAKLDEEALTFAIGTFASLPARFHRRTLASNSFVCIARSGHPAIGDRLTLKQFVKARHVLMTLSDDFSGAVDRALRQRGLRRQVVMTCTQFALLPNIIAQTDLIATVPTALASIAERAGCKVHDAPLDLPTWDSEVIWTQKVANTELGRFLIQAFKKLQMGF